MPHVIDERWGMVTLTRPNLRIRDLSREQAQQAGALAALRARDSHDRADFQAERQWNRLYAACCAKIKEHLGNSGNSDVVLSEKDADIALEDFGLCIEDGRIRAKPSEGRREGVVALSDSADDESLESRIAAAKTSLYGPQKPHVGRLQEEMKESARKLGRQLPQSPDPDDVHERAQKVARELRGRR